ncbi:hypothetical protein RRG08_038715 [Elysia crispata]|uniref:Uncharacterized protein n=1 Tax=Elysia crispata TaxID=231223 RepID=A0AAE1DGV2_9GAST|nr:hypothetical protein RRG08_038715 [Elysia crispata]
MDLRFDTAAHSPVVSQAQVRERGLADSILQINKRSLVPADCTAGYHSMSQTRAKPSHTEDSLKVTYQLT